MCFIGKKKKERIERYFAPKNIIVDMIKLLIAGTPPFTNNPIKVPATIASTSNN